VFQFVDSMLFAQVRRVFFGHSRIRTKDGSVTPLKILARTAMATANISTALCTVAPNYCLPVSGPTRQCSVIIIYTDVQHRPKLPSAVRLSYVTVKVRG